MAIAFISGYTLSPDTKISRVKNRLDKVSASGILRSVDLGAQTLSSVSAVIKLLEEADKETLVDWLDANDEVDVDLTVGTTVYRGRIDTSVGVDESISSETSHLWDVKFGFLGIKQ